MNTNVIDYSKEINKCENEMLNYYKTQVNSYEHAIQSYKEAITEYDASKTTSTIYDCSQLVAYNNSIYLIYWQIVLLDNTVVYESDNRSKWKAKVIDIGALKLDPGTQFKLKCLEAGGSETHLSQAMRYTPLSNTLYYQVWYDGVSDTHMEYLTMIQSPLSPPILKCSSLWIHNNALVQTRYEIRVADGNRTIYISGKCKHNSTWIKNLSELNVAQGTHLILHAAVIAGNDSEPYVIIEYDPTISSSVDTANFYLVGNAFLTTIDFTGTN